MDADSREALARTFKTARIVTATMLASLVLYAGMVQFLSANGMAKEPAEGTDLFRYLLYGLAVVTFLAVRFVRQFLLTLGGPDRPAELRLLYAQVVTGALIEAGGLYGLVLFMVTGLRLDALVLIALALVMMALYWPRFPAWESFAAEARRETGRA